MPRKANILSRRQVANALKLCDAPKFSSWQIFARALHEHDPKTFTPGALARFYGKNAGTVWWNLHPDWRLEKSREYDSRPEVKARAKMKGAERYQRRKLEPDFVEKRREYERRYAARKRNNAKLRARGDTHIFGVSP